MLRIFSFWAIPDSLQRRYPKHCRSLLIPLSNGRRVCTFPSGNQDILDAAVESTAGRGRISFDSGSGWEYGPALSGCWRAEIEENGQKKELWSNIPRFLNLALDNNAPNNDGESP
jgi:hypothetical protein